MPKPPSPPLPWTTKLFISAISFITGAAVRRDGSINRRLISFFDLRPGPNPTPVNGVSTSDHTVDPSRNLKVRLFSPSNPPPAAVVVYFHGGGFVFHSAFTGAYDAFCRRVAGNVPALVVSVDYRLAPEHRHPAAYDDGLDVLRWLDAGDLVDDLSAVFVAGDSAGGNIAHHVARAAMAEPFRRLTVAGLVAIQPFFGGEEDTESERRLEGVPFGSREGYKWMWRSFLPAGSSLDHEAANVFGPGSASASEEWGGFSAAMVVIGGFDTLQDRQRRYCEGLKRAGAEVSVVEYANAVHGFFAFPEVPEAEMVVAEIGDFVRRKSERRRSNKDVSQLS